LSSIVSIDSRKAESWLLPQAADRCGKGVAVLRGPWRLQRLFEAVHESFDVMRACAQRRGGHRHLLAARMKHDLPRTLTSRLANRRVVEHAICPALDVIRTVNLSDRRRQGCERRMSNCDGSHPIPRRQIGREVVKRPIRTGGNRSPDRAQQLFRLDVTESQRLVVIRLAGHALVDEAHAPSIDDYWFTIHRCGRDEDGPPVVIGHADHDWLFLRSLLIAGSTRDHFGSVVAGSREFRAETKGVGRRDLCAQNKLLPM
jgi:hypothetical protein